MSVIMAPYYPVTSFPPHLAEIWEVVTPGLNPRDSVVIGQTMIAHNFESELGWEIGKTNKSWKGPKEGVAIKEFHTKYSTDNCIYKHELNNDDSGQDKIWLIVLKRSDPSKSAPASRVDVAGVATAGAADGAVEDATSAPSLSTNASTYKVRP
jgi:hypothetical protein